MISSQEGNNRFPMTLLVGGAGFLGSHLCDRLIREGQEVICMDSLLTGRLENIRHLLSHPRFTFIHHDVTQPIDLASVIRNHTDKNDCFRVDYVLHLASPENAGSLIRNRIHKLKVEALGCYHSLGLAKAHKSVFLLASTPIMPSAPQVNLRELPSVDDEAKRFAESIAVTYQRELAVKIRIARIFNAYGERMRTDDSQEFSAFLQRALQGRPLTVYDHGRQTRNYCHASDIVEGLYKLLLSRERGPVDLGNPEECSVLEVAETIIKLTGSKSRIVHESGSAHNPVQCRPDISKATRILKWHPRVKLLDGIKRVIPYFRTQLADRWLHRPEPGWRLPFYGVDERHVQNN